MSNINPSSSLQMFAYLMSIGKSSWTSSFEHVGSEIMKRNEQRRTFISKLQLTEISDKIIVLWFLHKFNTYYEPVYTVFILLLCWYWSIFLQIQSIHLPKMKVSMNTVLTHYIWKYNYFLFMLLFMRLDYQNITISIQYLSLFYSGTGSLSFFDL